MKKVSKQSHIDTRKFERRVKKMYVPYVRQISTKNTSLSYL
jgi:hypothetical protein